MLVLTPKAFDVLLFLVQNRGRVLEKDELMKALWPESFVEEGNLSHNIFVLRKALGDDQNGNSFIQTIPRRGYKFVAAVKELDAAVLGSNLRAEELGQSSGKPAVPSPGYWIRNSPFRSLRAFEPEDSWLFFGRESETEDLLVRLGRSPILAVIGNSGSGKSSLIRAGLIPALHQGRFKYQDSPTSSWRVVLFRPSGAPFDYLAEVLPAALAPELSLKDQTEFIADCREKLPSGGNALRDAVNALANTATGTARPARILLVADQFEEIFTLTTNQKTRDRYINALLAASGLDGAIPVHLVFVLRADFYANCLEHVKLSRTLEMNLYNLSRMAHEQLRESIEKRLALAGGHAESGLIDSLLADVGLEPGDLALLEHALGLLWEKCGGSDCTLTNRAYSEIGRLRGALGKHADEVYGSIADKTQKELTKKIFLELVQLGEGAQDTRRRVRKMDLLSFGNPAEVDILLARLASSRLISTGAEGQQTFVEVSHEALIREWLTLREWIRQNREEIQLERRLMQAAEEWSGLLEDPGALLQGVRLSQAQEWLTAHRDASSLLQQFIQESHEAEVKAACKQREVQEREFARQQELFQQAEARAEAEKQLREQQQAGTIQAKRSALRLRWLSSALAVLLLVAIGAAWFAHRQRLVQEAHALAAQAEEVLPRDHGQALDLAIRSWRTAKTEAGRLALAKTFPELLATLKHGGSLSQAIFSPDGRLILTASYDHTARVWDAIDGRQLAILQGHVDTISDAEFSPDGKLIVTASLDHTARVWSSVDGRLLRILQHNHEVVDAVFSPDGRHIVTSSDDKARVWNIDGGLLTTLQGHSDQIWRATFSPDGQRIVTASYDHTARVWNASDGRLLVVLIHTDRVVRAKFSSDGQRIVTASWDHTSRIWNSVDGRLLITLHHDGPISDVVFSPDDRRIVTASYDHTARVWNMTDGRLVNILQHDGIVWWAAFSYDGQHIVTASQDHTGRVWNATNGSLVTILSGHTDPVWGAMFSPDGQRIITAGADQSVRVWNIWGDRLVAILRGHTDQVWGAAFSCDGQLIITASHDHTARVWNTADGHLLTTLSGHTDQIWGVVISHDSKRIVTASHDHTARIWNTIDGHLLATLSDHTDRVLSVDISSDNQRIVTASADHTARIWNTAEGRLLATLSGHTDPVLWARFSPDNQRIVTASADHTARVWNTADGHLLATLSGHTDQVRKVKFSPDGQHILTASDDHTARLWNAADGRLLAVLQHDDRVVQAVFSSDGRRVVTASYDHTARIWNTADGHLLTTFSGHTDRVLGVDISSDNQRIVTASADHTARVWNTSNGRLLAVLRHDDKVFQAGFSPDGRRIVTASMDQTVRISSVMSLSEVEKILSE